MPFLIYFNQIVFVVDGQARIDNKICFSFDELLNFMVKSSIGIQFKVQCITCGNHYERNLFVFERLLFDKTATDSISSSEILCKYWRPAFSPANDNNKIALDSSLVL